ncbi:hypothetical protein [Streptomyces sp. NBC_00233]|uniref:hypothetical protein n=1 Tax=Streptomyces sp. NBC_00233 TaxID=2975686 RepID=UPI0022554052|nr:hypothetical protein [Streptomyces sp. NBC_00233]MCX5230899.1 hypothetical protein [Streptomyces sp. NBC_00233]
MTEHPDSTLQRLSTEVLGAYGWPPFGGTFDLIKEWPAEIPTEIGVSAFLAGGDKPIAHPVGEPSIVCFGKAEQRRGVRDRVSRHRGKIKNGPHERWAGHPAHEWLARDGFCAYSPDPNRDPDQPLRHSTSWVEHKLIAAFQRLHRTRPGGNGTAA